MVHFHRSLVSRRTFIFARAGFGKSIDKLLFSKLYTETPMVTKRGDRRVPVGTVLADPDGGTSGDDGDGQEVCVMCGGCTTSW